MGFLIRSLPRQGVLVLLLPFYLYSAAALAGRQGAPAPTPTAAQPSAAEATPSAAESESGEIDTPRRALERFLNNARAGNLSQAADELWQVSQDVEEMAQLARKLQAVIDRRLPFDSEHLLKISDLPGGSKDDGLSEQEEIGRIEMPLGSEAVRLVRKRLPDGGVQWVFSQKTVERIPAWYERLPDHWLLDHLPESLLLTGPGGLLYWQWLTLPVLLLLSAIFGVVFSMALRLAGWMLLRRRELWKAVLERQTAPLRLVGAALALRLLLLSLFITAQAEPTVRGLCNVVLIAGLMFVVWRTADVLAKRVRQSEWLQARPALLGMAPLLHRLLEVGLWAVAVLGSVQAMGYSVTAVIASLGLGGLAVALAAKNSLEHLIGGMTLSLDQPMRVGDLVKVGDVQGTVEQIGIRSTRIRTGDRSLVTIPNGKLADLNIETLAARDRLRMSLTLNINYNIKPKKLRELREALIACIKEQPLVIQEMVTVNYSGLNEFAIPVELSCWFQTSNPDELAAARNTLLLSVLEVVDFFAAFAAPPPKK
jgi:MscS family membrane protein